MSKQKNMGKADLVNEVQETCKDGSIKLRVLSTQDIATVVQATMDSIEVALAEGRKVRLQGFGTFEVKPTKARTGRNPKTGEALELPAGKRVAFKAGKGLKASVNGEG